MKTRAIETIDRFGRKPPKTERPPQGMRWVDPVWRRVSPGTWRRGCTPVGDLATASAAR